MMSRNKRPLLSLLKYVAIIVWLIFVLVPIYTAIIASLTPASKIGSDFLFLAHFHWGNYMDLFKQLPFFQYFKSSLIYAVFSSILGVIIASFAAYALSRYHFWGKKMFFIALMVVQTIPQVVIVIPMFVLLNNLGLYDTYIGVILTITAVSLPLPVLMLQGFFEGLPVALEEAALIDGCNRLGVLYRIVMPLTAPGVMTAFALAFFTGWAEYLLPLVLTISPDKQPLTVGITSLLDVAPPWQLVMAGTLISIIPAVIVYLFVQRYMVQGLTGGGVKG